MRTSRRKKYSEIKVKGGVNKKKDEGITRSISANYNGFGPGSKDKIDQLVRERVRERILIEL